MCDRCYANLVFTVNTEGVMQLIMLKQFGGWGGGFNDPSAAPSLYVTRVFIRFTHRAVPFMCQ